MTCIVGCVKDNTVYMGCDSLGSNGHYKTVRKNTKMFRLDNCLIGYTSSFRMGQILQYKLKIPEHPYKMSIETYMNTLFIDEVIKCLSKNGYAKIENNRVAGGTFLVGYKGRLFCIDSEFQVGESVDKINACGSGDISALGAMNALLSYDKTITPKNLLLSGLKVAEKQIVSVQRPFKIMELKKE